jgi:hypothetical protein
MELFLATKVFEEDKHHTHFCTLNLPVPQKTYWYDWIKTLRQEGVLGDEFCICEVEALPTMKRLMLLDEEVMPGKYRLCFQHKSM